MKIEPKSILIDIFLTLLTAGLWNLWVQYRQMTQVNRVVGMKHYSPFLVLIFSIFTFGLYFIYHEYKLTDEIYQLAYKTRNQELALLCGIGTALGMWFIVDGFQQYMLNSYSEFGPKDVSTGERDAYGI